jgi:diguanylate cyclase (GGDEF)-like protein
MARQPASVRHLIGLLVPGGVLLLAAWAIQREEVIRSAAAPYALVFCCGALAAALLISWYYDQSRLLCVASVVVGTVWIVQQLPTAANSAKFAAVLLLPVNFVLFASVRERGVMSFEGFLKIGAVMAQAFGLAWLGRTNHQTLEALLGWGHRAVEWMWLPIPAIVSFGIAGMSLAVLFLVRRSSVEPGLLWALAAMLVFAVLEHGYDIAYRDELTGLPGRRAFNHIMEQLGGTYTLAMCDVDNFKKHNDTYGHETGDQILRMVAAKLSQVGGGGRAFRYGGEEFLLVFRGLSAREAEPFVDAICRNIASTGFVVRGKDRPPKRPLEVRPRRNLTRIQITVSAGVAGRSPRHSSPELVLDAADAALYRAKEAGRNRVSALNRIAVIRACSRAAIRSSVAGSFDRRDRSAVSISAALLPVAQMMNT